MGTNYYAKIIPAQEILDYIAYDVKKGFLEEAKDRLQDLTKRIHIGKSSGGWKFIFNHNDGIYYNMTRKSINNFLNREDISLHNEYGEIISVKEFWDIVDNREDDALVNKDAIKSDGLYFCNITDFS